MPDDPYVTFDAAYVLGALSPEDRDEFESHLQHCHRCTRAVQELTGLPDLLARAEFDEATVDDPIRQPDDLLPGLLLAARRAQRRRRAVTVSGWIAAAACAAAVGVLAVTRPASPAQPAPAVALAPMTAAADARIAGQVSLTGVAWGTRIQLKCSYPNEYPPPGTYVIVVVDEAGARERVGSWKVIPGGTSTLNASTEIPASSIDRLEVQLPSGETVLTLVN